MAASNARGDLEKDGNQDMWIDVQQSSDQLQRTMKSPRVVPSGVEPAVCGSAVSESANRRPNSGAASEGAAGVSVSSAVQQMEELMISDKQQRVSPPVRHGGKSCSPAQKRRHRGRDPTADGSQQGEERRGSNGFQQSVQGWRSVYDSVKAQPQEKVIQSVIEKCASEWYRLGIGLGYSDGEIQDMTFDKPTSGGKLLVIIEKTSQKDGKRRAIEALLDACDQIIPLGVAAVMEDLGINYTGTVPNRLLYEVGKEVGRDWKKVAKHLGLTSQDMDNIKMQAKSSRKRAWKMLQLWHLKMKREVSGSEIQILVTLQQIRDRKQTKSQIFPENVHIDKRVCGRQNELNGIAREFWGQTADKEIPTEIPKYSLQVVNGMGGIGKSAVSEKYATEWKKKYADGVFHFNAESLASLHISIRSNLRDLSLEPGGGGVFDDNKIFLQYIYAKDRVLLMYDGADDLNLLENILPRDTAHVHVLVTTRMSGDHPILARANRITSLGRLGVDAGVEALQAWRGHAFEELDGQELMFARCLVSERPIEGLPLAITHVATCIRMGRMKYQQYYELFKKEQGVLQALALNMDKLLHYFRISNLKEPLMRRGMSKPNDLSRLSVEDIQAIATELNDRHLLSLARYFIVNSNPVHLTWQLDIETVKDTDKNAMNLLLYISLMSCSNIPERVVRPLLFSDLFAYQYHMSVSILSSHTLVDVYESNDGCSLHMHPLVQSTLLERVMRQPEELRYRLNRMAHSLLSLLPFGDSDIECHLRDDQFLSLIPHVYAVAEKAVWIRDDETCDKLVLNACKIAYLYQHIDVTAYLCEERLKASGVSANNWQHLTALYEMGKAFDLMANPQSAQLHFMEALQLIENCSAQEKARMENYYEPVLGSLAGCYQKQQMFTDAERLYQKQLSLLKERPRENRHEISTVLNNLALSCSESGQTQKAIETFKEVLEMKRRDPETPSLSLSQSMQNMGWSLMENGQFEEALPLLERSLSIMRDHLPGDHVELAKGEIIRILLYQRDCMTVNNALGKLSRCCRELGHIQRAMSLCEESIAIASQCLPNGHPLIAQFIVQLASCHNSAGRLDQAIHLTQQSIAILRLSMPSTRKELCTYLNNLGQMYYEKGMLAEAVSMLEDCLAAERLFLTADHPEIGKTLWNLGHAYEARNDVIKATELWRECLSIREKCLSEAHPGLLNVLLALGDVASSQRHHEESLQMFRRAHDILKITSISPNSERMAIVCYNIGVCYMNLLQFEAAEEALLEFLRIVSTIYPPGHAEITNTEQLLHEVRQLKFGQC